MSGIRDKVLLSDLSSCDQYCLTIDGKRKVRSKIDYHIARYDGQHVDIGKPVDTSIPATDGTNIGTLADGYANVIISDGGIIEEDWHDKDLGRVVIKYKFECATNSWCEVDRDFPDDLYPDPNGPGYIHKDILGKESLILFRLTLTESPSGDSIINLTDNEGEVIDSINLCDIPCAPQIPTANPKIVTAECGWISFNLDANCGGDGYLVSIENQDANVIVNTDVKGKIILKLIDTTIPGPFIVTYKTTCEDGNSVSSDITINWTPPTVTFQNIDISIVDTVPYNGDLTTITSTCSNGNNPRFHLTSKPLNGTVILSSDGSYTYTSNVNYVGNDTFGFSVSCCNCCAEEIPFDQTFLINSTNGNIAITSIGVCKDTPTTFNLDSSITCELATVTTITVDSLQGGILSQSGTPLNIGNTFDSTLDLVYTPASGFAGIDVITFEVQCGTQFLGVGYVYVNVETGLAVNSSIPNVIISQTYNGDVSNSDLPCVLGNANYTLISNATYGNVNLNSDGTYTYVYDFNSPDCGDDTFTYQLDCDGCIIGQATETLQLLCCAEIVDDTGLLGSDLTYDVSINDPDCPTGVPPIYQLKSDSNINADVSVNSTGIHTINSFSDDCVGSVEWSYEYEVSCDGFVCDSALVSGMCPSCGVVNDSSTTEESSVGNLTNYSTPCEWHTTTYELVSVDSSTSTVTVLPNGDYTVDINSVSCPEGTKWSFTYRMLCGNVECGRGVITGDCCLLECPDDTCSGCGYVNGQVPDNCGGFLNCNCNEPLCDLVIESDGTTDYLSEVFNIVCGGTFYLGFNTVIDPDSYEVIINGSVAITGGGASSYDTAGNINFHNTSFILNAGDTVQFRVFSDPSNLTTIWALRVACQCDCATFIDPFSNGTTSTHTATTTATTKSYITAVHPICTFPITNITGGSMVIDESGTEPQVQVNIDGTNIINSINTLELSGGDDCNINYTYTVCVSCSDADFVQNCTDLGLYPFSPTNTPCCECATCTQTAHCPDCPGDLLKYCDGRIYPNTCECYECIQDNHCNQDCSNDPSGSVPTCTFFGDCICGCEVEADCPNCTDPDFPYVQCASFGNCQCKSCVSDSDCSCPGDLIPDCNTNVSSGGLTLDNCDCHECTSASHCTCPPGTTAQCSNNTCSCVGIG